MDAKHSAAGMDVDSETLSPLWFAGIYENHFKYQVSKDNLSDISQCNVDFSSRNWIR